MARTEKPADAPADKPADAPEEAPPADAGVPMVALTRLMTADSEVVEPKGAFTVPAEEADTLRKLGHARRARAAEREAAEAGAESEAPG